MLRTVQSARPLGRVVSSSVARTRLVGLVRLVPLVGLVGLVGLVFASTGCTVIGLGAGAAAGSASPRYEKVDMPPSSGTRVRILVATGFSEEEWVEGRYVGVRDGAFILASADGDACQRGPARDDGTGQDARRGECAIPIERARELRVRDGTQWLNGMFVGGAVGAALDLTAWIVLTESFENGCCAPR